MRIRGRKPNITGQANISRERKKEDDLEATYKHKARTKSVKEDAL